MSTLPAGAQRPWPEAPPEPALLTTKLYPPRVRPDAVARARLTARLAAALSAPLTVVVAPPGSGKSSLLAAWLHEAQGAGRTAQGGPGGAPAGDGIAEPPHAARFAWLSLDAGDNDPATFARYLVAALRGAAPGVGAATLAAMDSPRPPALAAALAPLVNELAARGGEVALILDDFHLIHAPEVAAAAALLCEHGPPGLHLVLAGRSDPPLPLARMRARRQLVELRAADLRFSPDEAAALLNSSLGLGLSPDQVAALEARTEGWAAGLQLAALALRDKPDPAALIEAFRGDARYVLDYLGAEVLDALPAHLRDFLLRTSLLPRLCGELCDAVLGLGGPRPGQGPTPDSYSRLILDELERRNLFLIPLDDRREWYRYHHLFADVLRARLRRGATPDELAALHRRAGAWLAAGGSIPEAVEQLLAGGDGAGAGALIAAHSRPMLFAGHLATVRAWLAALPAAQVHAHPALAVAAAWSALFDSDSARGAALAAAAGELIAPDAPAELRGEHLALRSLLLSLAERHEESVAAGRAAAALLPPGSPVRLIVAAGQSFSALIAGDIAGGERVARAALAGLADHPGTLLLRVHFSTTLGMAARMRGRLRDAAERLAQAVALLDSSPVAPPIPTALPTINEAAVARYLLGDLAGAAALLARVARLAAASADPTLGLPARWLEARLAAAAGDLAAAAAIVDEAAADGGGSPPQRLAVVLAERVRVRLLLGDLPAAEAAGAELAALVAAWDAPGPYPDVGLAPGRLLLAQGRAGEALAALDAALARAEGSDHGLLAIQALALRSVARAAAGDAAGARADLARSLGLAAAAGAMRVLLDEGPALAAPLRALLAAPAGPPGGPASELAARLLEALAAPPARDTAPGPRPAAPALAEPLTPRELEVLRLLALGRSNRAIAGELVVAVGTVKRHVANLAAKLDADSRLAAVARARELGLI